MPNVCRLLYQKSHGRTADRPSAVCALSGDLETSRSFLGTCRSCLAPGLSAVPNGLAVSLSAPRRGQSDCCYCPSSRRPRPRVCLLREEAQDSGILADVFPSLSSPLGPRGWVVFFPVIWSEHSARVTLSDSEVSIWTVTGGPCVSPVSLPPAVPSVLAPP